MTISELIDHVAADAKVTKAQAKSLIDTVFGAIHHAAGNGAEVAVPGFGKFKVQAKPARTGRNPRTGASVSVDEKSVPFFKAGKELRLRVNAGKIPRASVAERKKA